MNWLKITLFPVSMPFEYWFTPTAERLPFCHRDYDPHALNSHRYLLPLYFSSLLGLCDVAEWLLNEGVDINAEGIYGPNVLHAAVTHGHISMIKLLLRYGITVNGTRGPSNALIAALSGGREDIVRLLLENGADFDTEIGEHGSVLQAASYKDMKQ